MSDRATREWLRNWNAEEFLAEHRSVGRAGLPHSSVLRYAADHDRIARLLASSAISAQDINVARMLEAVTAPLAALRADPIPRYYSYTGLGVLDQYVDGERLDLDAQKKLCVEGIRGLMLDLTRFEAHSLAGVEPWSRQKFEPDAAIQRLKLLRRQFESVANLAAMLHVDLPSAESSAPRVYPTLEGYCCERHPLSAVAQFTCLPSSCSHDEVLFLRTIAEDELCFKAIYLAVRQAGEALERGLPDAACLFLSQATAFAHMLHESFRVLQSMPPAHFIDFREVTGQASAVQSFNYQRLDIVLFGMNPEKVEVCQRVPHLKSLLQYSSPQFASLRSMLNSLPAADAESKRLTDQARILDCHLLSWRGLHLSFALRYLPPETLGTGGTAGPSYLRKFFRQSLFADTEPDFQLIDEIFGGSSKIEEIFRARQGTRIAPDEKLWVTPAGAA